MDDSSSVPVSDSVRNVANILDIAAQKLEDSDYASAQVMVGVALEMLEGSYANIEAYTHLQRVLRKSLETR